MEIIKLNAIPSTNDYLKKLTQAGIVENFCCVVAENQTQGRGQMGAEWTVDEGKNLTFSVFIKDVIFDIAEIYLLNVAVAVSLFRVLKKHNISKLSVKWPNDIMAENKKIGGILIENTIKGDGDINSIVGVGINVNQMQFTDMPSASSMAIIAAHFFDKEELLIDFIQEIQRTVLNMKMNTSELWSVYKSNLFKISIPVAFEVANGEQFMGIIKDVNPQGLLVVERDDDSLHYYNIKEIKMLY